MALRPTMRDERIDQPAMLARYVAIEKGPDMVAAGPIPRLDQQQAHFGPQRGERQCDQSACQPAAYDDEVMLCIHDVAGRGSGAAKEPSFHTRLPRGGL